MKYTVEVMMSRFNNGDVKGALTAASKLTKKEISTEQKQTVVEAVEALKDGAEMTDEVVLTGISTIKEMMGIPVEDKPVLDSHEEVEEPEDDVPEVEESDVEEDESVEETESEIEVEPEVEPEVEDEEVNDEKIVEEVASVEEVVTEKAESGIDKDLKWVLITIGRKGDEKGQLFVTVFDGDSRAKLTELQNEGKAFVALSTVSKLENLYNNNFDVRGGKGIKTNLTKRGIEDTLRFVDNLLYIASHEYLEETVPVDLLGAVCSRSQVDEKGETAEDMD